MPSEQGAVRRVAVLNPLNDYGIAGYTHEFAEGLAANGHNVSVYSDLNRPLQELPDRFSYQSLPVLGRPLVRQRFSRTPAVFRYASSGTPVSAASLSATPTGWMPRQSGMAAAVTPAGRPVLKRLVTAPLPGPVHRARSQAHSWVRKAFLSGELAFHLWRERYDLVWTQWFSPEVFDHEFWALCKHLRLPIVHTVHNVLPHEPIPSDWKTYDRVYAQSRVLVVHSRHSREELRRVFPQHASKAVVMPHGTYSSIHQRIPQARQRLRAALDIRPDRPVLLFCGAIRPYKNIDAVIEALAQPRFANTMLVVAGTERGYPDLPLGDALGRTRALVRRWGVEDRVRLLPRVLATDELSEMMEVSDVLVLPYLKGYGSGLLLLGITFGKHIVTTAEGGAEEYLANYPCGTLLKGTAAGDVARGLDEALQNVRCSSATALVPAELTWKRITEHTIGEIEARLSR